MCWDFPQRSSSWQPGDPVSSFGFQPCTNSSWIFTSILLVPFWNFCELQASIEINFTGFLGTTKLRGYPNRSFTKVVWKSTESQALLDCVWLNKNTELERPPHSLRCRLQGHTPVTATVSYYTKAKQEKEKERRVQSKCYYFRNDSFFPSCQKGTQALQKEVSYYVWSSCYRTCSG